MIVKTTQGDILKSAKCIAFPINVEGIVESEFQEQIVKRFWRELMGVRHELGDVLTKTIDGITFYALACYSKIDGWGANQASVIEFCFNQISSSNPVASLPIGKDLVHYFNGADMKQSFLGMADSSQEIELYCNYTLTAVETCISEQRRRSKAL